jgi:hypothetical protein
VNIPWNCDRIKYRIEQINFKADFLITTADDYIKFDYENKSEILRFTDKTDYDEETLVSYLNTLFQQQTTITLSLSESGRIIFSATEEFTIPEASHRAKYLLGLMAFDSVFKSATHFATETPSVCFGHLLYLSSQQGQIIETEDQYGYDVAKDVIYRINQFMVPNLPVIINKKQNSLQRNSGELNNVKIQLTDRYFQPLILQSPLYVALKIKPV